MTRPRLGFTVSWLAVGLVVLGGYFYAIRHPAPVPAAGPVPSRQAPGPPDNDELRRVKALFSEGRLKTADDYLHAAVILQHGDAPEDFHLAHDLCVAAIIKGKNDRETWWLAASAEDRFLTKIGSDGGGPFRQSPVDETVAELNQQP